MNIFYIDEDPLICASYHHDIHLRKMIVETAQLLSTAHHVNGSSVDKERIYKIAHLNHPSNIWARTSKANYEWLNRLFVCMLVEYQYRFGKNHKSDFLLDALKTAPDFDNDFDFAPPPLCMPDAYKTDNAVQSYRNFYIAEKKFDKNGKFMASYTKRNPPAWFSQGEVSY